MKKKTCKLLSLVLAVLMLMSAAPLGDVVGMELPELAPTANASSYLTSGYCGDTTDGGNKNDIYWELSEDGVLIVTGTGNMVREAFNYDLRIKEVVISDGITNISAYCFNKCENLTKVTMGKDIISIDSHAFSYCLNLIDISFAKNTTTICEYAFYNCTSLKQIELPEKTETIGNSAFNGCTSLTDFTLPSSLKTIGYEAFRICDSITEIVIPDSVNVLPGYAFTGTSLTSVVLGAGVTSVEAYTFGYSPNLASITVSENNAVYSSLDGILYDKEKTEICIVPGGIGGAITVPATIEKFDYLAISSCKNLTDVNIEAGGLYYKSIDGIVYSADGTVLVVCPRAKQENITVAEGTQIIGSYAFASCSGCKKIVFPQSLITIKDGAFDGCRSLESITFSEGLTSIEGVAFRSCSALKTVSLPDSVNTVSSGAFESCSNLRSVYLGACLSNLSKRAFSHCYNLENVTVSEDNENFTSFDSIIYNKDKTKIYSIPAGINGAITLPTTLTELQEDDIPANYNITDVNIENGNRFFKSVDGIVYSADGTKLIVCPNGKRGAVFVENGTTEILSHAFSSCVYVDKIVLPDTLKSIGSQTFYRCEKLTNIVIPDSVDSISPYAFQECVSLQTISIPNAITKINNGMFASCGFEELTFPESIQSFDHASWSKLKTLTILNRYCEYTSTNAPTVHKDCVIRAYCGSPGHTLAVKQLLNFESIGHTYLDWYTYTAATFDADGIERRDCAYCDGYEERVIPKLENDVFTATFVANGEIVATVDFPKGTTEIAEPKVPAKDRYMGAWEDYTLADADITINAVYTLIKSDNASEIEADSEVIHYTDKDDVLFRLKASADALVVKSTVSKSVPLDIVLVVDQSGSMADPLGGKTKKVDALKETAIEFVNTVFENAKITEADHRISIVGFGLSGNYQGFEKNENTELLTSSKGIVKFDDIKTTDYASSLLSVNVDGNVNAALRTAIDAIDAKGATAADLGFEMAKGVFANTDSEGRQRIVIFMTDGEPTYLNGFQTSVANAAIYNASLLKNAYDASIYSVGVFASTNRNIDTFMNAVSSGYPDAMSMSYTGTGVDGQYYITINNTDALSSVFKTISTESLSHTAPFDDITIIKTLSENVTMTTKQEEQMRIDLIRKYGITNDDIIVTRNDDGTTTIQINGLTPYEVTDADGNVKYEVTVEFFASLNEKAAVAGDYVVDTDDSGVMLGEDAKGYEATFETSTITLTTKKTRVIFTVNGEVYEVSEKLSNGYAVAPEIEIFEDWVFSGWDTGSKKATNGLVLDATITKAPRTITWCTADGDITQNYYKGDIITSPEVGMTADGRIFLSWDKSIPTTMPDENLVFTAVYGEHVHNYTSAVTKKMTCTEDGIRTFTCFCGETYDEVIAAIGHNYEAMTPSVDKEDAKCTFCCTNCGDKYDYALEYQVVQTTGKKTKVLYEFNLTDDALNTDMQPDGAIQIRIPLSDLQGSAEKAVVYRYNDDGTKTQVSAVHEKGFLVITCDHFTPYEVIFDIPCSGHKQGDWVVEKEPTCSAEGYRYALCTECEKVAFEESIAKLTHDYAKTETPATCTKKGVITYTCTTCGDTYTEETEKADHKYTAVVTSPTCTEQGFTTYTCTCGDRYDSDFVATVDHADKNGDYTCDSCGEDMSPANNCSHICHKDGIMRVLWMIMQFFWKLFKMNPVCECGAAHY